MIFYGWQETRVGSPPGLGTDTNEAFHPYKCRIVPIQGRNLAMTSRVKCLPAKVQVELESRFTGRRGNGAGYTLALGRAISHIPILVDVWRTS